MDDRYEKKMFKSNCKCLVKSQQAKIFNGASPLSLNIEQNIKKEKKKEKSVPLDPDLLKFYGF